MRTRTLITAIAITFTVGTARSAEARPRQALLAYGKLGAAIPVSKLDPHVAVRLGGGYLLPVLKQRLALVFDLGYSQHGSEETISDPRLGTSGGEYTYNLTQHDLNLYLGPQFYILDPFKRFVPYVTAGLDLHFLRSDMEGHAGEAPFGENEEQATRAGFALRAGVGWHLGPGMLTGELAFNWAPLDVQITGDGHLGRLAVLVGYTAMIGF